MEDRVASGNDLNDAGALGFLPALIKQVRCEERYNVMGRPKKFQIVDFVGMAFGAYFIYDGWTRRKLWNTVIGSMMFWIHVERFVYAPQNPREVV